MMGYELYKKKATADLTAKYEIIPLCPELMGGLPTPREGCDVISTNQGDKVIGRDTRTDYTAAYEKGAQQVLRLCTILGIRKAYLLKKSPSCGPGYGICAKLLEANGIGTWGL
jgi:uncharacterized protein YbbK (DUF523 family)